MVVATDRFQELYWLFVSEGRRNKASRVIEVCVGDKPALLVEMVLDSTGPQRAVLSSSASWAAERSAWIPGAGCVKLAGPGCGFRQVGSGLSQVGELNVRRCRSRLRAQARANE